MAFSDVPEIPFKFVGQPYDLNSVLSPDEIWAALDQGPESVREALVALVDALNSSTEGSSGSENVGSPTIPGIDGNTVYDQIASLLAIAQAAQAGSIAPGSILDSMLSNASDQIKSIVANHLIDTLMHISTTDRNAWNAKETPTGAQAKADAVQTNLTNHIADLVKHITSSERTTWNAKETTSGSQTKADTAQANAESYADDAVQTSINDHVAATDPHTVYIKHALATAANDFVVASGAGAFIKKTLAEVKTILGLGSAAYTASTAYATAAQGTKADNAIPSSEKGNANGVGSLGADGKSPYSELPAVSTSGTFTDTTTSISANATYTKTIPLGFAGVSGSCSLIGYTGTLAKVNFFTTQSWATSVYNGYGQASLVSGVNGNLYPGCNVDTTSHIKLQNCYINGTDLVFVFKNTDSSSAYTLKVTCYWEVQA